MWIGIEHVQGRPLHYPYTIITWMFIPDKTKAFLLKFPVDTSTPTLRALDGRGECGIHLNFAFGTGQSKLLSRRHRVTAPGTQRVLGLFNISSKAVGRNAAARSTRQSSDKAELVGKKNLVYKPRGPLHGKANDNTVASANEHGNGAKFEHTARSESSVKTEKRRRWE
ncbi:hypothetical protein CBL_07981 [Carabus blaptoides fortunei]